MHRGLRDSLVTYHTVGEDAESIMRAVADKDVGVAIVWGPLAGYWARQNAVHLECTPVHPESEPPGLPFTFEISIGVRKGNTALRDSLQQVLARRSDACDPCQRRPKIDPLSTGGFDRGEYSGGGANPAALR